MHKIRTADVVELMETGDIMRDIDTVKKVVSLLV